MVVALVSGDARPLRPDAGQASAGVAHLNLCFPSKTGASTVETFDDFLVAARTQPEPQRLLLVFARAECPPDATAVERAAFERGEGGALVPAVCVDKLPEDLASFAALHEESVQAIPDWQILFVASMDGRAGHAPNPDEAVQPLRMMVEQIKGGRIARFLAVNRDGRLVDLQRS